MWWISKVDWRLAHTHTHPLHPSHLPVVATQHDFLMFSNSCEPFSSIISLPFVCPCSCMRRPKVNGRVPFKSGTEEQDAPVLHLTAKYIQIKTGRLTVGNRVDQSVGQHKTNTSSPVRLREFPLSLRRDSPAAPWWALVVRHGQYGPFKILCKFIMRCKTKTTWLKKKKK